jgi:hypothetical protein
VTWPLIVFLPGMRRPSGLRTSNVYQSDGAWIAPLGHWRMLDNQKVNGHGKAIHYGFTPH